MDEKQVKPVLDMVVTGILSVPRVRTMLGIPAEDGDAAFEASQGLPADMAATGASSRQVIDTSGMRNLRLDRIEFKAGIRRSA